MHDAPRRPVALRRVIARAAAVAASAAPLAAAPPAAAQNHGPASAGASAPSSDQSSDQSSGLTRLPHLGLYMEIPPGAVTTTKAINHTTISAVRLPGDAGVILIQTRPQTTAHPDPASLQDAVIAALGGERRPETPQISVAGRLSPVTYTVLPRDTTLDVRPARGVCVIPGADERFTVFELVTTLDQLPGAAAHFEALLASVTDRELDAQDAPITEAVAAGINAMLALSDADLRRAFSDHGERVERLYRPSGSGELMDDEEAGFRKTRAWLGARGELLGKPEGAWSPTERTTGYLLKSEAKLFLEGGASATSESLFFVSENRREEFWSIEIVIRKSARAKPDIWREHGQRNWDDLSVFVQPGVGSLTVLEPRLSQGGDPGEQPSFDRLTAAQGPHVAEPDIRLDSYLSRGFFELLGPILAQLGRPGNYAYAVYDSDREAVKMQGARLLGGEDGWTLIINATTGGKTLRMDGDGVIQRVELADGRVWEPIDPQTLRAIYQRKGLDL